MGKTKKGKCRQNSKSIKCSRYAYKRAWTENTYFILGPRDVLGPRYQLHFISIKFVKQQILK